MSKSNDLLMTIRNLKTYFPIKKGVFSSVKGYVKAVDDVSIDIYRGETIGIVGESGCGKTTLGRTIIQLLKETEGTILYNSNSKMHDLTKLSKKEMDPFREKLQIVFQDPYSTLNPKFTVFGSLSDPLKRFGIKSKNERKKIISGLLKKVNMPIDSLDRFPNEFSGGQRQRIGIARALSLNPELIICDEIVSALDVSIQAQVLVLLNELKEKDNLTYVFISHDLRIIEYMSDRVIVMYLGKVMEQTTSEKLFDNPVHPYTRALISAIPRIDPATKKNRIILEGDIPDPSNPPSGCPFRTRCRYCKDICIEEMPAFVNIGKEEEHLVACHFAEVFSRESF